MEREGFAPAAQPPITPAFGANASQARPLPSRFALLPRRSNPLIPYKKETPCYARDFFFNGEGGIRTHAPFRTNGFQDRLVMTTSIPLQSVQTILQFTLFLVKDITALN